MGALASLKNVQAQITQTLSAIDPNTTDPQAAQARRDARAMQVQASQAATDISSAIRKSSLDIEA
ncbi:MAG: hypothetical protein WD716_00895 [Fimbriimonadaceae bacterium]